MNILLTNLLIGGLSGTEQYTCTLARAFVRRGHVVAVYSPSAIKGGAPDLPDGLRVCRSLDAVGFEPDILHCHHLPCAIEAVLRWPRVPSLFVVHDATAWHDAVPPPEGFDLIVAVDKNCARRAARDAPGVSVQIVPNPVDQQKISATPRNQKPRSLLIYGKSAGKASWNRNLRLAALANGIWRFEVLNGARDPLTQIGRHDVIFARARCAIEACLSGAYTVLFDRGLCGGAVTPQNVEHLLSWNFGRATLKEILTYGRFKELLRSYSAATALEAARILQPLVDPAKIAASFEFLYRQCISVRAQRIPSGPQLMQQMVFARNLAESLRLQQEQFPRSRRFFGTSPAVLNDC